MRSDCVGPLEDIVLFLLNRWYNFFIFAVASLFFSISAPCYYYYYFFSFWCTLLRPHTPTKTYTALDPSFCLGGSITTRKLLEVTCKEDPRLRGAVAAQKFGRITTPKTSAAVFWSVVLLFKCVGGAPFLMFKRVALLCWVVTRLQGYTHPRSGS